MNLKKYSAFILAVVMLASAATLATSALTPYGHGLKMRGWLVNDPNYQFSPVYRTSVWYRNFNSLELTANDRNNVLRIAVSQLGYHEGDGPQDLDGMNFTSKGNYTEYARIFTPLYEKGSFEWCATFVNWCLNQARFDKASSEMSCWKWAGELKAMDMFQNSAAYGGTYTPKPADFIFFNWNGVNTDSRHIGYVLYTTDTHVYTLEGNADNCVTVKSYELTSKKVIGYGTPPYEEGDEPTIDYSYKDGMLRGTYVINANGTLLNKPANGEKLADVPIGTAVVLYEVEGSMAKVRFGDLYGYLPVKDLYLMTIAAGEDTVTYDANGGEGAPEPDVFIIGEPASVADGVPTLEGDTFLGWSVNPYDVVPVYRPGDSIFLKDDTTLYAVWEHRSVGLANQAFLEGKAPSLPRPDTITNSSAILLGTLPDLSVITETGDTKVQYFRENSTRVPSFVTTGKTDDPFVTLPYGEICKTLGLTPVSGDDVAYVILRVKNVFMNDTSMAISFNGSTESAATATLADGHDWQYVVFDLSEGGFTGELDTLRIDWGEKASEAGITMLITDVYFASNKEVKDALIDGKYVFPAEEDIRPDEPPVDEPTVDLPIDDIPVIGPVIEDLFDGVNGVIGSTDSTDGGCSSLVGAAALISLLPLIVLPVLFKKKDD